MHAGNAPLYYRFGMCDTANAMLSVVGLLAALYHQRRTGEGQELWTSLLDGGAVFASDALLVDGDAVRGGPQLDAGQHGIDACYRLYETQRRLDPDRGGRSPSIGSRSAASLGVPELADDPRFATATARREHRAELEALLERRVPDHDRASCGRARSTTRACRTRSRSTPRRASSCSSTPTTSASGSSPSTSTRSWGACASSARSSTSPRRRATSTGRPPRVGEHTREILEWLGYDEGQRTELRAEGVVYWPDDDYSWTI